MSQRTLLVRLAGALVGIVAIAFAAATIDNPIETGGSDGVGGDGEGGIPRDQPDEAIEPVAEIPAFLKYLVIAIVVVLAIAFAWYLINHRREAVKLIAIGLVIALVVAILGNALLQADFSGMDQPPPAVESDNQTGGEPGTGEGDATIDPTPLGTLLIGLVAVATIFVGALVLSGRGDESDPTAADVTDDEDDGAAAVGAAAGRAAERIESSDDEEIDNEVYRAWRDMTRLLEVDRPETSTPGEFATAAVEAGLARDHVDELTRLFEDVRYGHAETTADLEARAVETLRRIEEAYTDANDERPDGIDVEGGGRP